MGIIEYSTIFEYECIKNDIIDNNVIKIKHSSEITWLDT